MAHSDTQSLGALSNQCQTRGAGLIYRAPTPTHRTQHSPDAAPTRIEWPLKSAMSAASSPADFADDLTRRFTVVSLRVPGLARTCPKG